MSYETVSDTANPFHTAIQAANLDPILASFNVEAYGPDSSAVIDVTRFYTAPVPEMGAGAQFTGTPDVNPRISHGSVSSASRAKREGQC